ncbi:MAG: phosphoglucosamine mutase [Planctomycetes bacterium]|nr:phosphoglucosamine mutase [Planctomycetota bacterium]MCW8136919.1 phosphoglucosamine mutase [Planctomycetota bacterium]
MAKRRKPVKPQGRKQPRDSKRAAKKARRKVITRRAAPAGQRLFGTDGVRAPAGTGPLAPHKVLALGRALGAWLHEQAGKGARPVVLLGVDPRPSADMVGTALAAGLIAEHCDVHWPGMMSTPEVAWLTGHGPFAAGVMITASHNPAGDNGIKIFGKDGLKLPESIERKLERAVLSGKAQGDAVGRGRPGWLHLGRERHYEEYIVKTFRKSFAALRKRALGVVFDAAFGARSIDLQVLSRLAHSLAFGRTVPEYRVGSSLQAGGEAADNALDIYFLNAASPSQPDTHHLINDNCGSLYPQGCAAAVKELKADLGVAFDGDGDRCILIDETGTIRDGDYMLAVLAADMKARGTLKNDTVVTTTMANLGLQQALKAMGVNVVLTDVGDRYVSEAMEQHGAVLGGEQSGHVIIRDEGHVAGDGLYTALRVIEVMLDSGKPLSALCAAVTKFPQTIVNVKAPAKPPLQSLKNLGKLLAQHERELGDRGRINVRYSGTEPLLRIMVEAPDQPTLQRVSAALANAAKKDLA